MDTTIDVTKTPSKPLNALESLKARQQAKLRAALDQIESYLLDEEINEQLWFVLTALRGPDNEDARWEYKNSTTSVIRQAAFPNIGKRAVPLPASFEQDREFKAEQRKRLVTAGYGKYSHFSHHAAQAFKALGLDWEKVNE